MENISSSTDSSELKSKQRLEFFNQQGSKDQFFNKFKQFADKIRKDKRYDLIARKRIANVGMQQHQDLGEAQKHMLSSATPANVMQILEKVVVKTEFGSVQLVPQTAKERLQELRNLRFKINEETEEVCIEFINQGGIHALSEIILSKDASVNLQIKEEAVWIITNMSMLSSMYEKQFECAANALMYIVTLN